MAPATISDLPTELLIQIMSELPWADTRRTRLVCRHWNMIALLPIVSSAPYRHYRHDQKNIYPEICYIVYIRGRYYGRLYVKLPIFIGTLNETTSRIEIHRQLLDSSYVVELPLIELSGHREAVQYYREGALPDTTKLSGEAEYKAHALRRPHTPPAFNSKYDDYRNDPMMLCDGVPLDEGVLSFIEFVVVDNALWNYRGGMGTSPMYHNDTYSAYTREPGETFDNNGTRPYETRYHEGAPAYVTIEDFDKSVIFWAHKAAEDAMAAFAFRQVLGPRRALKPIDTVWGGSGRRR